MAALSLRCRHFCNQLPKNALSNYLMEDFMVLTCFFDASFHKDEGKAIIAVLIKRNNDKLILKCSKVIQVHNNTEAEFRAINKMIGYIIDKQKKEIIPTNLNILIYGDNEGVVSSINRKRKIRTTDGGLFTDFIARWEKLNNTNSVALCWIDRKNNEADSLTRF